MDIFGIFYALKNHSHVNKTKILNAKNIPFYYTWSLSLLKLSVVKDQVFLYFVYFYYSIHCLWIKLINIFFKELIVKQSTKENINNTSLLIRHLDVKAMSNLSQSF